MMSQNLLIKNPTFKEQFYGWDYGVYGSKKNERPIASFAPIRSGKDDNSALSVQIERNFSRGDSKQIYLIQDRIKLKKNKNYKVSFYIKSNVLKDKLSVSIGSGSAANGRILKTKEIIFKGDGSWKKIELPFIAKNWNEKKEVDFKNAALYFGFNFRDGEYQIDNVKVERVKK